MEGILHCGELDDFDILECGKYCFELYNKNIKYNTVSPMERWTYLLFIGL